MAASFRSQRAWFGRREGRREQRALGMTRRPSTMAAVTASNGPTRACHSAEASTTEVTCREGVIGRPALFSLSRIYEGRKQDGKGGRCGGATSGRSGDEARQGRRETDEAMATRERPLKKRSRPSRSEAGKMGRRRRGVRGREMSWGVAKTCPSSERCPSGKLEKISRASCHGQPERMAWRKTQKNDG